MSRYFIDTEFIEDGRNIDLISIGVVSEDGRPFYAEVPDDEIPWHRASQWVLDNVRPHLTGGFCVVPKHDIGVDLLAWMTHYGDESPPEFWGYYADYDWVVLCQLYGTMMDLPEGWPMFCMDLKQLAVSKGNPTLPEQTSTEHHALADARWNRHVYEWLTAATADPTPDPETTDG